MGSEGALFASFFVDMMMTMKKNKNIIIIMMMKKMKMKMKMMMKMMMVGVSCCASSDWKNDSQSKKGFNELQSHMTKNDKNALKKPFEKTCFFFHKASLKVDGCGRLPQKIHGVDCLP